jgi:hypothetical protein
MTALCGKLKKEMEVKSLCTLWRYRRHLFSSQDGASGRIHTLSTLTTGKGLKASTELQAVFDSVGLDALEKWQLPFPCRESNHNSREVQPVA